MAIKLIGKFENIQINYAVYKQIIALYPFVKTIIEDICRASPHGIHFIRLEDNYIMIYFYKNMGLWINSQATSDLLLKHSVDICCAENKTYQFAITINNLEN